MIVLGLDASTYSGTVAIIRDGSVIAESMAAMRGEREERLMPALVALLSDQAVSIEQVGAVACGAGPGSFTSLRIAASIAKGICTARDIPLLAVPSTLLIAAAVAPPLPPGAYVAALDAMRGDFFCQDIEVDRDQRILPGSSWRGSRDQVEEIARERGARIIGPLESPAPAAPHARGFARLLREGLALPVELSTWEPEYGRKAEAQVRWETTHGRELGGA